MLSSMQKLRCCRAVCITNNKSYFTKSNFRTDQNCCLLTTQVLLYFLYWWYHYFVKVLWHAYYQLNIVLLQLLLWKVLSSWRFDCLFFALLGRPRCGLQQNSAICWLYFSTSRSVVKHCLSRYTLPSAIVKFIRFKISRRYIYEAVEVKLQTAFWTLISFLMLISCSCVCC